MDKGQTRVINRPYRFGHRAVISLYEQDDWDADDFLGEQTVTRDFVGKGEMELNFMEDDARYGLWIEVLNDKL